MPYYKIFLFLFFFYFCFSCTCGFWYCGSAKNLDEVTLFLSEKTKICKRYGDVNSRSAYMFFGSPFAVSSNGRLIVFAEASQNDRGPRNVEIVVKYTTERVTWRMSPENNSRIMKWRTQLAMRAQEGTAYFLALRNPVAFVNKNKIYVFYIRNKIMKETFENVMITNWEFELVVGKFKDVNKSFGSTDKLIRWNKNKKLAFALTKEFKTWVGDALPHYTNAILTQNKLIFVVRSMIDDEVVSSVIYFNEKENVKKWNIARAYTPTGCIPPAFIGWEGSATMIPHYCFSGDLDVKVLNDKNSEWKTTERPISRLWDYFNNMEDITTVKIGRQQDVVLFTQRKICKYDKDKYDIYLWMSDGNRLYNVGPIFLGVTNTYLSGFLYTNGELLAVCYQRFKRPERIFLKRLNLEKKKIKTVLKSWNKMHKHLSQQCIDPAPQHVYWNSFCSTQMPTEGLVGFLFSNGDSNYWYDEYFFSHAEVSGGKKIPYGFIFSGPGAGAKWTVGDRGDNYKYNFAKHGLTIVATVTIYDFLQEYSSLLTVGDDGIYNYFGLWYRSDGRWGVRNRAGDKNAKNSFWNLKHTLKKGRPYKVALILRTNKFFVYIHENFFGTGILTSTHTDYTQDIRNIFIGNYRNEVKNGSQCNFAVTNVFLYNRPFFDSEIKLLGMRIKNKEE